MDEAAIDRRRLPEAVRISEWRAPDGWMLRRLVWSQPEGAEERGRLLLAGGRGDFLEKNIEAMAHWHRRGWAVASFDWRGQGGSRGDIVGGHLDSFDPLVVDGAALIADWRVEGAGPHVAVGHSMGGHLLLRILAEGAAGIDAAVLVAPMIGLNAYPLPPALGGWIARCLARSGFGSRPAWKSTPAATALGSRRQMNLTRSADRYVDEQWWKAEVPGYDLGPPSWGWMNAAYVSATAFAPEVLAGVKVPILILGAERDRLVSAGEIRRVAAILPDAELVMYADAAHELLREEDRIRDQVFAAIDSFLDRRAPL